MASPQIIVQHLIYDGAMFGVPCDGSRNVEARPVCVPMGAQCVLRLAFRNPATFAPMMPARAFDAAEWRFELRDRIGAAHTVLFATAEARPDDDHIDIDMSGSLTDELASALGERTVGEFPAMLSGYDSDKERIVSVVFRLRIGNTTDDEAVPEGADSLYKQVQEARATANDAEKKATAASAAATEADGKAQDALDGLAGKADLVNGKVPSSQLPSYVDDVLEFASRSAFPATGEAGKIYVALDTNKTYRWSGSEYVQVGGGDEPERIVSADGFTKATARNDGTVMLEADVITVYGGFSGSLVGRTDVLTLPDPTRFMPWTVRNGERWFAPKNTSIGEFGTYTGFAIWIGGGQAYLVYTEPGAQIGTQIDYIVAYTVDLSSDNPTMYGLDGDWEPPFAFDATMSISHARRVATVDDVPVKTVKRNGTALVPDAQGAVDVEVPTTAADVGAANQTAIAAAFTAKEYAVGELATYNGLLYRCKSEYTATASSAKPDADTTHWEAVAVAVLLDGKLSTSGGTVNGYLFVSGVIQGTSDVIAPNGQLVVGTVGEDATNFYTSGIRTQGHGAPIQYPAYTGDGTDFFALIQHIAANFSISASYVVGQLVVYQGTLYRCANAHSAGAWDANDFTAATVEDALAVIRAAINGKQSTITASGLLKGNGSGGVIAAVAGTDYVAPSERNLLDYTTGTTLAPQTAVYRAALNADGTFPTITDTAIPTASAYYCFELELSVPSTVPSTITGPSGWDWLDGGEPPDPSVLSGGETIFVACRMDCATRAVTANVWRVA